MFSLSRRIMQFWYRGHLLWVKYRKWAVARDLQIDSEHLAACCIQRLTRRFIYTLHRKRDKAAVERAATQLQVWEPAAGSRVCVACTSHGAWLRSNAHA